MNETNFAIAWLFIASIILYAMMGIDKKRAINNEWRIPEARLFLFALLGGAVGGCLGMKHFHHKTKHWQFKYGFPLIAFLQMLALLRLIG